MHKSPKKRLIFCTYTSVYSSIVLKKLLADDGIDVVGIVNSTRVISPNYGFVKGAFYQIKLSGWRYSSYLFMVTDLFSWLQSSKTIHALAKKNTIPIIDTLDINSAKAEQFITSKSPDFLLAAHFNQLVKAPLLDLPCINIHPSLLPEYKGVDPVFYAMLDHQKVVGVTLHKMAASFDTGEILLQKELNQNIDKSVFSNNCRLFEAGADLVSLYLGSSTTTEYVDKLDTGNKQYDSWPTRFNIKKFKQEGSYLVRLKKYWQEIRNV